MSQPISTNARALLDTIRLAEGTWRGGKEEGYSVKFGGGLDDWRKGRSDRVVHGNGYSSQAHGAYQFMGDTWNGITKKLGMDPSDFSPAAQDRAAIGLIRQRGVNPDEPITPEGWAKLAPEWASLPTLEGKSYYGQPVKARGDLERFYQSRLGANPGNDVSAAGGGQPAAVSAVSGQGLVQPPTDQGPDLLSTIAMIRGGGGATPAGLSPENTAAAMVLQQQEQALSGGTMLDSLRQLMGNRQPETRQRMAGRPGAGFFNRLASLSGLLSF